MPLQLPAALILAVTVSNLTSCGKGDEELHRQIVELRAEADAKAKSVAQLESQMANLQSQRQAQIVAPAPVSSVPSGAMAEELKQAKARITELEESLAAAKSAAANPEPASLGKLDTEEIAARLEEDLTRKAKQLRELVQRQSPSSRIDEISLKSIEFPPQLITPFNSAITFTVTEGTGASIRLMFPVTADLRGSWTLPTPDEIQKAYKAAQQQPAGGSLAGSSGTAPASPQTRAATPSTPLAPTGTGARMTQRSDGVFVFDWGDSPSAGQAPAANNRPQPAPAASQTINNYAPPASRDAVPQPKPAPRSPAAAPQAPATPPPVMPIVGDRIIRFND